MCLPSGLPKNVSKNEPLARFLTSSGHFNATYPKPAAFLPNPKNGETSVFRQPSNPISDLVAIATQHLGTERSCHGVAMLSARDVRDVGLDVVANEPPPRHADIVGWLRTKLDPALVKAQQKKIAIRLAQKANLVRFPS